jgi:hypothetical protein
VENGLKGPIPLKNNFYRQKIFRKVNVKSWKFFFRQKICVRQSHFTEWKWPWGNESTKAILK